MDFQFPLSSEPAHGRRVGLARQDAHRMMGLLEPAHNFLAHKTRRSCDQNLHISRLPARQNSLGGTSSASHRSFPRRSIRNCAPRAIAQSFNS